MDLAKQNLNVFVAGLGRCGTTLVMTMLDRGGFPVGDMPPAYETCTPMRAGSVRPEALTPFHGIAVKWIDPTVSLVPAGTKAITVWLDRDPVEQARSQLKLMGQRATRRQIRALASSLHRDTGKCHGIVRALGPCLFTSFERILSSPSAEALRMQQFLGDMVFDPARAADAVRPRSPACASDLAMEFDLMSAALTGGRG